MKILMLLTLENTRRKAAFGSLLLALRVEGGIKVVEQTHILLTESFGQTHRHIADKQTNGQTHPQWVTTISKIPLRYFENSSNFHQSVAKVVSNVN